MLYVNQMDGALNHHDALVCLKLFVLLMIDCIL